ncbi:hypothetical protein Ancab_007864 [Ancistrocladus abbreviatus]
MSFLHLKQAFEGQLQILGQNEVEVLLGITSFCLRHISFEGFVQWFGRPRSSGLFGLVGLTRPADPWPAKASRMLKMRKRETAWERVV